MPALQHGSGYQAITCLATGRRRPTGGSIPLERLSNHSRPGRVHSPRRNNAMAKTQKSTSQKSTSQKSRGQKSTSRSRSNQKNRAKLKSQDWTLGLQVVHPKAAGIDVGNAEHWVAVPPHMDPEPVRQFGCYTVDLVALADWLQGLGIQTVAMQSTGVH